MNRDRPTKRIAFETLGCKLNQYETDAIATAVVHQGYEAVPLESGADAYVINSCTVTNKADRKSRNTINRALRFANTHAPVIVTGCFVDSSPVADNRVHYWVNNEHKNTIPQLLDAHFRGETVDPHTLNADPFDFAPPARIFHTRTNLKVQDGCDNFCTFCIIPFVRGRAQSRPVREVLREAETAIAGGSRELVLTGVNMSRYSHEGDSFVSLLEQLLAVPGDFRVRISSLEPDQLDERFIELFQHEKMCPHLHLCLQSGSNRILLKMRRMYTREGYDAVVRGLRQHDSRFNITTDIIVGFPGEDEGDIAETLEAVRTYTFGHVHIFPYSLRSGTRAERLPGTVSPMDKSVRSATLQREALAAKETYRRSLIGTVQRVLVEKVEHLPGHETPHATGLGEYYVPVSFPHSSAEPNSMVHVRITGIDTEEKGYTLLGEPLTL